MQVFNKIGRLEKKEKPKSQNERLQEFTNQDWWISVKKH